MNGKAEVLIAGAGPTGLVLALWLAKSGVSFRLIDKKPEPGAGSRAMVIQARTIEFYRQLGLADDLIAAGFRVERLHLRNQSRELAVVPFSNVGRGISPYPFALSLPQDDHERFLIKHLHAAGGSVEWNTELTGFTQSDAGVIAMLRRNGNDEQWSGQYICGCDGAHSTMRRGLGISFPGGTYDQLFFVADAESEGEWTPCDFTGYLAERTFCLCFPVRTQGMFRYIGLVPAELKHRDDVSFDELRPGLERVTSTRIKSVNWYSTYRVHHRVADSFRKGKAFLCGDAGHVHSPAGGQGMNTGIGDAINLAWKLAAVLRGRANQNLLNAYETERLPFARSLVKTTDLIFEGVVGQGLLARLSRVVFFPVLLPFALKFAVVRRAQFRLVSQVRVAYPNSPLSDGVAGVRAGERLPWVEGTDNYAPMASRDWQVHVYGTASAALRDFTIEKKLPSHEWQWSPAAKQTGLQKDALYLVRPDGHIGFARNHQDVPALDAFMNRFGIVMN